MIEKLNSDHFLIREIVESYVQEWKSRSGQRDHQKRGYFYMSDVAKCDRATFYDFTCPEKKRPITAKTLMMFSAGNLLHDDIQRRARSRGLVEAGRDIEYGLEDWAHKATGRLDFITAVYKFIETERGLAVAEIKTKNPYNFDGEEPTQDEIDQILWYIDRLKASSAKSVRQSEVLDYGFVLYLDRAMIADPLPICGWRVDFDPERVEAIKARFAALDKAVQAGEIPKRPHERDSIKCSYCRYLDFCWEGIPRPEAPAFVADETVEKPEQELVESAAARYIELKAEEKKVEDEVDRLREILMRYFKATGLEQISANGQAIIHGAMKRTALDEGYLLHELADKWLLIARPDVKKIQAAIKDGMIDAGVLEQAKITTFVDILRIKGGKNADPGTL
jgi:CRISPR/Cas system-associated exonuclease Cas4 (RecB family)